MHLGQRDQALVPHRTGAPEPGPPAGAMHYFSTDAARSNTPCGVSRGSRWTKSCGLSASPTARRSRARRPRRSPTLAWDSFAIMASPVARVVLSVAGRPETTKRSRFSSSIPSSLSPAAGPGPDHRITPVAVGVGADRPGCRPLGAPAALAGGTRWSTTATIREPLAAEEGDPDFGVFLWVGCRGGRAVGARRWRCGGGTLILTPER